MTGVGAFEALIRRGRRREGGYLQLLAAPAASTRGRVGLIVGKKALPLAVDRNRIRRILRESLRNARPGIEAYDVILRLTRGCPRVEYPRVAADAAALIALLVGEGDAR